MKNLAAVAAFLVLGLVVAAGIALLRVVPEKKEAVVSTPVSAAPAPVDTNQQKMIDEGSVNDAARFIKETKKKLVGYYPDNGMMESIGNRKMNMAEIAGRNEGSKDKTLHALGTKAHALQRELQSLARHVYAKAVEQKMLEEGINMKIQASGTNHTTLQVKYALISDAFVYQMQNKAHIDDQARALGFSRVVFTDGFDTTYTIKLD